MSLFRSLSLFLVAGLAQALSFVPPEQLWNVCNEIIDVSIATESNKISSICVDVVEKKVAQGTLPKISKIPILKECGNFGFGYLKVKSRSFCGNLVQERAKTGKIDIAALLPNIDAFCATFGTPPKIDESLKGADVVGKICNVAANAVETVPVKYGSSTKKVTPFVSQVPKPDITTAQKQAKKAPAKEFGVLHRWGKEKEK